MRHRTSGRGPERVKGPEGIIPAGPLANSPDYTLRASSRALSVLSQVKLGSVRPKCP